MGLKISNGHIGDDWKIGYFTCHTAAESSIVDYCLTRQHNFELVENFYIGEINTISDHAYLELHLKIDNLVNNENRNHEDEVQTQLESDKFLSLKENYNCKYIPVEESERKIKDCLDSDEIKSELVDLKSKIEDDRIFIDDTVKALKNLCINISDRFFKKVSFAGHKNRKQKNHFHEWYDDDCKKAKTEVNKKRKSYQQTLRDKLPRDILNLLEEKYFQSPE